MSESTESARPSESETAPNERRAKEVKTAVTAMLAEKAAAAVAIPPESQSAADKALSIYSRIQTDKDPQFDISGNSLKMPGFSVGGHDYNDNETSVAGFYGTTADGLVRCSVNNEAGDIIKNTDGSLLLVEFPRDVVADAQLHSEQDTLKASLSGDEQKLFTAHVDALSQNDTPKPPEDDVDDLIEGVGEKYNLLTTKDAAAFVDTLPNDKKPLAQGAVDRLGDQKLMSQEDFKGIITAAGYDQTSLQDLLTVHTSDRDTLQARVDTFPADGDPADKASLINNIDKVTARITVLEKAQKAIEPPPAPESEKPDLVGKEIAAQRAKIADIINKYTHFPDGKVRSAESLSKDEQKVLLHSKRIQAELALAERATGVLGPLKRMDALQSAQAAYKNELKGEGPVPVGIESTLKDPAFLSEVTEAKGELQRTLNISDAEMAALETPDGLDKFVKEHEDSAQLEAKMFEMTFNNADKTELNGIIDDINKAHADINDTQWKSRLKDFITRNPGKRAGILALILLAIPVVAAGITVSMAGNVASGAMK